MNVKNVYYPLAGMNYVIDDLAQIIENKMEGKKEINLWLSAQVNCYPHVGTLTNFISAFALAKHLKQYYNKPVKIIVELLESVTGEEINIDGNKYYKNLDSVITDSGETIKEKYLPYFKEILDKLKELDNIDNLNIIEKRNKLDELEKLIEIAKLNENQKSVYIYYLKVQQLIALELVDSINISEISKFINFFDLSKTNEIENEIQKKLELHNIRGSHATNN